MDLLCIVDIYSTTLFSSVALEDIVADVECIVLIGTYIECSSLTTVDVYVFKATVQDNKFDAHAVDSSTVNLNLIVSQVSEV